MKLDDEVGSAHWLLYRLAYEWTAAALDMPRGAAPMPIPQADRLADQFGVSDDPAAVSILSLGIRDASEKRPARR